jgi:hypothetical protein
MQGFSDRRVSAAIDFLKPVGVAVSASQNLFKPNTFCRQMHNHRFNCLKPLPHIRFIAGIGQPALIL